MKVSKSIVKLYLVTLLNFIVFISHAQVDLAYYLPSDVTYNTTIPTPEDIIGHQVGEWHVTHDKLAYYMETLASSSDRISIETIGYSYEQRPLQWLTITSPENHKKINEIREQHIALTDPSVSGDLDITQMPAVVFMGYSVHGNEASGANSALLVAYYLATAQGAQFNRLLEDVVILLHPSINPDGLNRFASWVNVHRSKNIIADPNDREHDEVWPSGRTNHYWFDLNRDWLPVQLKESKARMQKYHEWKPNIITDHHEMGTNSTFFFQPGIPSRNNPLTPENTFSLTRDIAAYHARALDEIGSLYYTEESFDDFYYGKGSTFPDINGGIGILFEQASSRGHAQESIHGRLDFHFSIRNQFTVSLSTLEAAYNLREALLEHQREFYQSALRESGAHSVKAFVFGSEKDRARVYHMARVLSLHEIEFYKLNRNVNAGGQTFTMDNSYIVPLEQPQYRLVRAMFDKTTTFNDSLFYDVSSWTLPLAFDLEYQALNSRNYSDNLLGEQVENPQFPQGQVTGGMSKYTYAFDWHEYYSPAVLNDLLQNEIKVKTASTPFNAAGHTFDYGAILVPVQLQKVSPERLYARLSALAQKHGVMVHAIAEGLNNNSIDIGSPSFNAVRTPKIIMPVGNGISGYESGEVWFLMDQRFNIEVTKAPIENFDRINLNDYNTLLLVNGNYDEINGDKLKRWLRQGGVIVATKSATRWLSNQELSKNEFKESQRDTSGVREYEKRSKYRGAKRIGGSIFNTRIDLTHPLCYGYYRSDLPVFRNSTMFMKKAPNPYANPVIYTENPLLSGYIGDENLEMLKGSAVAGVSSYGSGRIILITDNPNFRAFWFGTTKLYMNAIYFGDQISRSATY